MHVEIKPPHLPPAIENFKHRNRRIPCRRIRRPELDLEQLRRRLQHARLNLRIRKIRPHRLRIEIESRAPELLVPVPAARNVNLAQLRLPPARKLEHQRVLALRAVAAGLVQLRQKRAHIRRRLHHLVRSRQIGPAAKSENRRNLLPRRQQIEKNLPVRRIRPRVVGQKHPLTQRRARGKRHHRHHVRRIGGQRHALLRRSRPSRPDAAQCNRRAIHPAPRASPQSSSRPPECCG